MLVQEKNLESYVRQGMQLEATIVSDERASDQRQERRFPVSKTGVVHVVEPAEREQLQAYVMDVSNSGLKLRLERPLEKGTIIQVFVEDRIVLGEVRHCTSSAGRFNIGMLVRNVLSPPKRKKR